MNRIMKDNLFQLKPEVTIYYHEEQKQYIINIGGYDEGSIDVPHYCFDPVLNQEGETEGSGENKQTNKEKEIR